MRIQLTCWHLIAWDVFGPSRKVNNVIWRQSNVHHFEKSRSFEVILFPLRDGTVMSLVFQFCGDQLSDFDVMESLVSTNLVPAVLLKFDLKWDIMAMSILFQFREYPVSISWRLDEEFQNYGG